jgi:hypothetical protein
MSNARVSVKERLRRTLEERRQNVTTQQSERHDEEHIESSPLHSIQFTDQDGNRYRANSGSQSTITRYLKNVRAQTNVSIDGDLGGCDPVQTQIYNSGNYICDAAETRASDDQDELPGMSPILHNLRIFACTTPNLAKWPSQTAIINAAERTCYQLPPSTTSAKVDLLMMINIPIIAVVCLFVRHAWQNRGNGEEMPRLRPGA